MKLVVREPTGGLAVADQGTAGQALGAALKVAVEDTFGNLVTGDRSSVMISVASRPGGLPAAARRSLCRSSGVANFSNLLFNTAGTYTLCQRRSLTGAALAIIAGQPGVASKLVVQQWPAR